MDIYILDGGSSDGSVDKNFLRNKSISGIMIKRAWEAECATTIGYAFAITRKYLGVITIDGKIEMTPKLSLFLFPI